MVLYREIYFDLFQNCWPVLVEVHVKDFFLMVLFCWGPEKGHEYSEHIVSLKKTLKNA